MYKLFVESCLSSFRHRDRGRDVPSQFKMLLDDRMKILYSDLPPYLLDLLILASYKCHKRASTPHPSSPFWITRIDIGSSSIGTSHSVSRGIAIGTSEKKHGLYL